MEMNIEKILHVDLSQYVGDTRGNITKVKYAVRGISIQVCFPVG